jgi:GxxExxY protein
MAILKDVNDKVYKVIGACMEVHRSLGPGYPVAFYKKALEIEFAQKELSFETQKEIDILYKNTLVGTFELDFLVGDIVLLMRSQDNLSDVEVQQVLRCLQLTNSAAGVVVNFGMAKIQYKRVLPNYQPKEIRKDSYRVPGYRDIGKTREGNPLS